VTFVAAVLNLALWLPANSNAPIIVFAALYGGASGGVFSMLPAVIAQISSDIRKIGVRNGTLYALISIATLTGNPIGGALVSQDHGGFTGLKIFAGVTMLAGVCFLILARAKQVGFAINVKV